MLLQQNHSLPRVTGTAGGGGWLGALLKGTIAIGAIAEGLTHGSQLDGGVYVWFRKSQ